MPDRETTETRGPTCFSMCSPWNHQEEHRNVWYHHHLQGCHLFSGSHCCSFLALLKEYAIQKLSGDPT